MIRNTVREIWSAALRGSTNVRTADRSVTATSTKPATNETTLITFSMTSISLHYLIRGKTSANISPMNRYIAFLRAINVGGHTVKMDVLRRLFEDAGLFDVETFIASGNVIF